MITGETQNGPQLHELYYPNELRGDRAGITYVDTEGATYIEPAPGQEHDYAASQALRGAGLSSADVVTLGEGQRRMLRYSPGTDLLPLPALLNASVDREDTLSDIVTGLEQVALLLGAAEDRCRFVPRDVTRYLFGLDRGQGRAEFLAPFTRAEVGTHWLGAFEQLQADILQSAGITAGQEQAVAYCFGAALDRIQTRAG